MNIKVSNIIKIGMGVVTAILITVTGIKFKQEFLNILPLYISLVVSFLQTKVSRMAPLLGGLNSILYTVVYFIFRLYAMAAYALLFSFTFQLLTFIRWSRNKYGESTILKKLSTKQSIVIFGGSVIIWIVVYEILSLLNSGYLVFDNTITLLGILGSILMLLAYIEYAWLMVLTNIISLFLYVDMMNDKPAQITYLIFTVYSLICTLWGAIKAMQLYKEQQAVKKK